MKLTIRIIYSAFIKRTAVMELESDLQSINEINTDEFLEWIFRQFNAVDGDELSTYLKLRAPSLSVGDFVEFELNKETLRFQCCGAGWELVKS